MGNETVQGSILGILFSLLLFLSSSSSLYVWICDEGFIHSANSRQESFCFSKINGPILDEENRRYRINIISFSQNNGSVCLHSEYPNWTDSTVQLGYCNSDVNVCLLFWNMPIIQDRGVKYPYNQYI